MRTPTLRSIQRRWLKVPDGTIFTTVGPPALVTAASHAPTDIAWLFEIARCANNYVVARTDGEPDAEAYAALVRALGLAAPSDAAGDRPVVSATDVLGIAEGTERAEWGDRQWQDSEGDAQPETP